MDLNKASLNDYLDSIAAETSTPGGGSVTAVTAAQAVGLLSMVSRFTAGREKFRSVEPRINELLAVFEAKRQELTALATEDINVFGGVMAAYKMPKDAPDKQEKLQEALKKSSEVPFTVFSICRGLMSLADELEKIGNPMLVSDVIVARTMLKCCMDCSVENVEINLVSIKDKDFCAQKRSSMRL